MEFVIWSGMPEDFTDGNRMWGGYGSTGALRVDSVAPDPPVLLSPANGATINDNTPSFDWSDVIDPSGVKYSFEVDDNADFGSQVIWLTVTPSEYTVPSALADGRYYWRVESDDGGGNASLSAVWYFDVDTSAAGDTTLPAAVTDLAAITATSATVTLTWTAPGDDGNTGTASAYVIRYATATIGDANWGSASQCSGEPAPQAAGNSQTFTVTGLSPDTTYYFAMKTADEVPNWSGLSNIPSRKTEAVTPANQSPAQPGNTVPTAGATGVSLTPTLSSSAFSDPDAGDTHAASQWQIDDSPWDYQSPAFDSGRDTGDLTSITVPYGKLINSNLYWWRVRHQDGHGAWSDWSAETSFITTGVPNQKPAQPAGVSPVTGANEVGLTPTLSS
jgi:hypothetical protein